ncbi:hypothetical protein TNCV_92651 [Trichonephila clavipes]|nr:hypothetical protein TNCV_92651 [Trichonephila clavipes]
MREKVGNHLVLDTDYMVDALKLSQPSSQRFWRVTTEACVLASHYRSVCSGVVLMEHNTSSVGHFWSIASFKRSSC